jgi:hypothetical protein
MGQARVGPAGALAVPWHWSGTQLTQPPDHKCGWVAAVNSSSDGQNRAGNLAAESAVGSSGTHLCFSMRVCDYAPVFRCAAQLGLRLDLG